MAEGVATELSTGSYFPIRLAELRVDTLVEFDLYLVASEHATPVLYRESNLPFTEDVKGRLLESGVSKLFVREEDEGSYYSYVEGNLRATLMDENISMEERSSLLYNTSAHVVRDFMKDPRAQEVIPRTEELMSNIVNFVYEQADALFHFLKVGTFDYKTYTHSVNVTMYSLTLAQHLDYNDAEFLQEFGMGTLLHDIGKSLIPQAILDKKDELSEEEWHVVKQHPQWGCDILREHGVSSELVHRITLDHHEKLDGSGYPRGLSADEIQRPVRLATICDVFDALTTRRSYKGAAKSFGALKTMRDEMGDQLDEEYFKVFIRMMCETPQDS